MHTFLEPMRNGDLCDEATEIAQGPFSKMQSAVIRALLPGSFVLWACLFTRDRILATDTDPLSSSPALFLSPRIEMHINIFGFGLGFEPRSAFFWAIAGIPPGKHTHSGFRLLASIQKGKPNCRNTPIHLTGQYLWTHSGKPKSREDILII